MPLDVFLACLGFALAASITPGPNTLMLMASGVNFGFRRTVPHMVGIGLGFMSLLSAVGFGLGAMFAVAPQLQWILKIVGGGYLLYLAYRIATTRSVGKGSRTHRPMTVVEAAAFQWVNPKAWMMGIAAMAIYTAPEAKTLTTLLVIACFAIVLAPSVMAWAGFGTAVRDWLAEPRRLQAFNVTMGIVLALSLVPMLR